jgi:AcrR family transcriptional regulator
MSQNSPLDLRVRRTRKLLRDALVALITEHGYEAVRINDVCDRAMINRATFYRHFADKGHLLVHCMDDVFEDLQQRINPPPRRAEEIDLSAGYQNIVTLFTHVSEHAAFYRVMLGEAGAGAFRSRIQQILERVLEQRWEQARHAHRHPPRLPPALTLRYQTTALIGLIQWWVEQGCAETPLAMAQAALDLMLHGVGWAFGLDEALIAANITV